MLQYVIHAPRDGQVAKINYSVGENVPKNAVIVKFVEECKDCQKDLNTV
jgi:pyruvate/2-oxoglutarate dehydrogenase complex dihydrolipoamide acyltransferase (E2) component